MMMRDDIHATLAQSMVNDFNSYLGGSPVLQCWDGTPPATCEASDAGTKLCELACSTSAFGSVVSMVSTANTFADDTSTVAGNPSYWRLKTATGGDTLFQWTEGVDMVTDDPPFGTGDTAHLESLTLTFDITPPDF